MFIVDDFGPSVYINEYSLCAHRAVKLEPEVLDIPEISLSSSIA